MRYTVKVIPNAKKEEVIEEKNRLVVRIKEKPEKGKATMKVIKVLENYFKKKVNLVRGAFSREKVVEVED